MTRDKRRSILGGTLAGMLLAASALAGPVRFCPGGDGCGGRPAVAAAAEVHAPCGPAVRIPCRGQPYLSP